MANAETGENALNEMYNFIMAGISAGTAALDGKAGTAVSVKMGGVDVLKGQLTHSEENHYEGIGRFVGDSIGVIGSIVLGSKMKNLTVQQKAAGAFGTSQAVANIGLGDTFANLFNTYVANADAFYTKILTDEDYAGKVWDGIVTNGLNTYVDYFDPDHDGVVSASDIVNGYKELFSPPPAFGTAEFYLQYNSVSPSKIVINTPSNILYETTAAKEVLQSNQITDLTLNNKNLKVENLTPIQLRNAIDGIDKVSFLLSNILIKVGEQIDLGAKGVYTVKSGDSLSVIAQNNGYVTKDLVKLNPWLFDDNRIQFNYPTKVLVAEGTVISDNVNHTIYGDASADNILIDHNGGDDNLYGGSKNDYIDGGKGEDTLSGGAGYDVLLGGNDSDLIYGGADDDTLIGGDDNASDALFGGSGADVLLGGGGDDTLAGGDATNLYGDKEIDYLEGGVGYDTYFVSHQDIISDADNSGFILFNDKQLNGKKTKLDENTYEDTNFTYSLDGNNLIVVDKNLGEYITIENFKDGAMGRNLDKEEKNAKDILVKISNLTCQDGLLHVVVNKRDFSTQKEVV